MPHAELRKANHPLTPEEENLSFAKIPIEYHIQSFGVPYIRNPDAEGGFLYVTRWGWHHLSHLRPENWFTNKRFVKEGTRLRGSTGTVYYFPSHPEKAAPLDLLVKVSRIAEDVPGKMAGEFPELSRRTDASFNSPFEEFGLVEELRSSEFGPSELHVRTKRPMAIYCAPKDLPDWQLGRVKSDFHNHLRMMETDQASEPEGMKIHLLEHRQYFSLYAWVPGLDAQAAMEQGLMSVSELEALSLRVNAELAEKGFRILDNKPKHIILRQRPNGELIRYHGKLIYVQIDFELLQRTEAYLHHLDQPRSS
ncbi:hypothetical protein P3T73_11450 [Kiritimatiellota bacterium B12222]|nr:hypothetical protein P3T73_11450 [Kiritimatiellota bacterium B12222]